MLKTTTAKGNEMTKRQMMDQAETLANETGEVMAVISTPNLRNSHRIVKVADQDHSLFEAVHAVIFTPAGTFNMMSAHDVVAKVAR